VTNPRPPSRGLAPLRVRRARVEDVLAAGLDELRARGAEAATLWVFTANHAARSFYARFGFVPDGAEGVDECTGVDELRLRVEL
jgi:GNAT superfamily N-acetyltransferase